MNLYVLDTDTLSLYQRGHPLVCQRCGMCQVNELAITIISIEEQLSGWYSLLRRAKQPAALARAYQRLTDTVQFLAGMSILSFTQSAIVKHDQLATMKLNVGKMD